MLHNSFLGIGNDAYYMLLCKPYNARMSSIYKDKD